MTQSKGMSVHRLATPFTLAGDPSRGLGASRRPFGDVRFDVSPASHGTSPSGQHSRRLSPTNQPTTKQSITKVSTLNQDLTELPR